MPESPRWLLSKGKEDEAREILKKIRPKNYYIESEISDIKEAIEKDKNIASLPEVIMKILKHQPTRRALTIGCSLQLFQQISGINTIMYYSATVVQMVGIGNTSL